MRVRTLEIRWHDQKPISTCDFQPTTRKSRVTREQLGSACYRLATGGEDNNIRIWFVRPNILPPSVAANAGSSSSALPVPPHPPRVEYRSTLSKHSAAVNVVRFSPNGELLASAGDDGMIIIWSQTDRPPTTVYGSDNNADEDPEHWKVRISFRCTTNEIYDLAWSPTGEYIIAGSTDNAARIFSVADGTCVRELVEHNHYVQGVAWDPMNEYIATQSSDRAVHVYGISTKNGVFETHAVGKNARMHVKHSRTPAINTSSGRPRMARRASIASDNESAISEMPFEEPGPSRTPTTSIANTPTTTTMFPPPQVDRPSSRRSSFSGSNAPASPAQSMHAGHFGRSPSPMPPLPAIRPPPPPAQSQAAQAAWSTIKLYGDESFTNFFRRLNFSPDGALLLTPAGQFEDQSIIPGSSRSRSSSRQPEQQSQTSSSGSRSRRQSHSQSNANLTDVDPNSASSVYIYTRANFARPPVAQLPGHKKASVAVKFSPVLYELRKDLWGGISGGEAKRVTIERGKDIDMDVDIGVPASEIATDAEKDKEKKERVAASPAPMAPPLVAPLPVSSTEGVSVTISSRSTPTPAPPTVPSPSPVPHHHTAPSPSPTPASNPSPASVFALPYRMLFAIATMDTITIHDTQQASPVCMFTKLHYDEFTDMSWSPDGQCLLLTSRDGFCTIIVLDEYLSPYHTQQQALQLQTLAHSIGGGHNHPHHHTSSTSTREGQSQVQSRMPTPSLSPTTSVHHFPATASQTSTTAGSLKRSEPDDAHVTSSAAPSENESSQPQGEGPPKKKRRVALTRVGDIE
ncbi:hypothetical protein M422DRAFT_75536 [Sphaerobolus stellatus SS14]|uniref:CAF1B/HIR1 beta-propeller domain-containing protein n=1 Tax=Sphaerobolus stellatus (strain SS14) TaxID=990650 RepID=A0A0C9VW98_SPHS4|nr:hypothetical protein M422DRAFT_75536 [Sphaerobolus stellatus SS14]